ncbi:MAG: leucine-rich repeat domain-containing protein, partial [Muribaculaceae bacterium]|nr:leucine-rich repeat domain-containing protein [Muribaculaceae bacterium]
MKKLFLSLLGLLVAVPIFARDFDYEYEGQTITYTVIDEEAKTCETKRGYSDEVGNIFAGNNVSGDLVLPSNPKDGDTEYTLVRLSYYAFCKSYLKSITIPNSVTEIRSEAFSNCSNLTSVIIGNSVTLIGKEAFYECSGMTSVTIGNSVTQIGESAFYGCSGLISITIPNSVTEIGSDAFYGCSGLISITIPNSVTEIGSDAFYGCSG